MLPIIVGKGLKKGLIAGKSHKVFGCGRDLYIVWLKKQFARGESFAMSDIDKTDVQIHFCDKDSLETMIDVLIKMRDEWDGDSDG